MYYGRRRGEVYLYILKSLINGCFVFVLFFRRYSVLVFFWGIIIFFLVYRLSEVEKVFWL